VGIEWIEIEGTQQFENVIQPIAVRIERFTEGHLPDAIKDATEGTEDIRIGEDPICAGEKPGIDRLINIADRGAAEEEVVKVRSSGMFNEWGIIGTDGEAGDPHVGRPGCAQSAAEENKENQNPAARTQRFKGMPALEHASERVINIQTGSKNLMEEKVIISKASSVMKRFGYFEQKLAC
jgi:hypothetical protein